MHAPDVVDVVALGESMVTFLPTRPGRLADVPSFDRAIGGAESNVACALAAAGHTVRWVSRVGADGFGPYSDAHRRLTAWVVGAPMAVEGVTALALVASPPDGLGRALPLVGLAALAVVLGSTVLVQVPLHARLGEGYDAAAGRALVRSNAPAGSTLSMSARDLLTFARMHMNGGKDVLSPESVRAMQETQVQVPDLALMGDAWGLGWELFHYPQAKVIGHDGGTIGQNAFLRLVPEHGVAVALLTNGGKTVDLYQAIFRHVLRELTGAGRASR